MANCEASIWRPRTQCTGEFPGADPTLSNGDAALIIGAEDTSTPHTAEGPSLSQAKANATTAANKFINTLGGNVTIGGGGSIITLGSTSSIVQAWNSVATQLEQVLTLADRFFTINPTPIAGVSYTVSPQDVGFKTEVSNAAAVAIAIDDSSSTGVTIGQEMLYFSSGAGGISGVTASGLQTLIAPAGGTVVELGRTFSLQLVAVNTWLYTGP